MKRAFPLIAVPIAAILLGACGSNGTTDSGQSMAGRSTRMSSPPATGHDAQDVTFAQMMIPHHRQATTMADLAATRASSSEVKRLATQIKNAQQPEIEKMTGWLKDWGASTSPPGGMHTPGMMSEQDMKKLEALSGRSFDKMFLQMMIKHHKGAVTMAKTEQEQGANPDAKALASSIVASQSAEITRMQNLLKNV